MKETLVIRNMVCPRCIMAVEGELHKLRIPFNQITLGRVILDNNLSDAKRQELSLALRPLGFELLDDPKARLVNDIKNLLIREIREQNGPMKVNYSTLLSENLNKDFSGLSRLFSGVEGITLERYILRLKTERVKELLFYEELTLSEIAFKLGYSSTAHLSTQFKKETGMTPTAFRELNENKRKPLDSL